MISKVVSFGDSIMYGDELPYDDEDMRPLVDQLTRGIARDHTGAIRGDQITPSLLHKKDAMERGIHGYGRRCNEYSMGGYLSRRIGVPWVNYSYGGYGNDAIMAEIMLHRHELDASTFVLVGLTYHTRRTRLLERNAFNRIVSVNNFVVDTADKARYLELDDAFGDDLPVRYLQVHNHLIAVRELLSGVPHLIIDPTNAYRENPEINGKVFGWAHDRCIAAAIETQAGTVDRAISDAMQHGFNRWTFGYTLNHAMAEVMGTGSMCRQPFQHPTRTVHELYIDRFILPFIRENGLA